MRYIIIPLAIALCWWWRRNREDDATLMTDNAWDWCGWEETDYCPQDDKKDADVPR